MKFPHLEQSEMRVIGYTFLVGGTQSKLIILKQPVMLKSDYIGDITTPSYNLYPRTIYTRQKILEYLQLLQRSQQPPPEQGLQPQHEPAQLLQRLHQPLRDLIRGLDPFFTPATW